MKYKQSRYNIVIDTLKNGDTLLYNTFTGALGLMDATTRLAYEKIKNMDIKIDEGIEPDRDVAMLIRYGYVVPTTMDELATFMYGRNISKYNTDHLALTIAPTLGCNMRCPYCYEDKNGSVMNNETQLKLIRFIKAHLNAYQNMKYLTVTWYGGEPLLQKDRIYNLSKEFISICAERNITYSASMVTNGVLLDRDTAKRLYEDCKVGSVQVTIDGRPEIHDARRILANGKGSFDTIVMNIEACKDFLPIVIRINVDTRNEAELEQLIGFFYEKGWGKNPSIYPAPVETYSEHCADCSANCIDKSDFAKIKLKVQQIRYEQDRDTVVEELFPRPRTLYCGHEKVNSYVIDPDGYCYNCWLDIGRKELSCGHVNAPFAFQKFRYKWISNDLPEKCEECEYLPMCSGGCAHFRTNSSSNEPSCPEAYFSYKETLRLAYLDYVAVSASDGSALTSGDCGEL